jgi:hypothetical protein
LFDRGLVERSARAIINGSWFGRCCGGAAATLPRLRQELFDLVLTRTF